ncbi:hypothetical protein ITP53_08370 [Nonomuraea sp. K274]|uniref:YCII-related domain-containing protein n=1 Tax=Nonomuraea cypriaca TaxID=1187855 RepID=A0A931A6U4_9ACTN|nr:YciI family protein [Nonomuraea cypriaca]MBF8185754.1 hypothetical protein [Nonomuraea cypriaca]
MKFVLNLYLDSALPGLDHEEFLTAARQAGELIGGHAFADPSISVAVRVRDGSVTVTEGPYLQTPEHVAGQYVVDCESRERALELAALIQDAGIEVRPLMDSSGLEM